MPAPKTAPDRAAAEMRAAGLDPRSPYPGAKKPWPCRCTACGNEVTPRLDNIRQGNGGCRHCAYNRRHCAYNRVDPDQAAAEMRVAGLDPLTPYPGTGKPWPCRCTACGNEVTPRLDNIRQGQGGCRHCASNRVDADRAAAEMRVAGLDPLTPYPGAKKPWPCRCSACGNEVAPRLSSIRQGNGGCRHCAYPRRRAT